MKNLLEEFKNAIKSENYIFHIHTNYTDGKSSVIDYFEFAFKNNNKVIIFTEHVRKNLGYDFDGFVKEIKEANEFYPQISVFIGCEAKLLPGGDLDIPLEILANVDVICFACHSFPKDLELYKFSLRKLFLDDKWRNHIRVWVHPGRFLKKLQILDRNLYILQELIEFAISEGVFIEKNLREKLPPIEIIKNIPNDNIILGYDAHSINELTNYLMK
jgi:histidinol phosphatase-like PHP family hydrolase